MDWNSLFHACATCQKCAIADTRRQTVYGAGNPDAKVLLVGLAPGELEEWYGQPFLGQSGIFLDNMLTIIDLYRQYNVYITNLLKCHPPNHRSVLNTEYRSCLPYLRNQVALIQPKIIVCLGETVATRLIGEAFDMETEHGVFFEKAGVQMMGIPDPYLLWKTPNARPKAFDDLKLLQQKIWEVAPETYQQLLGG